MGTNETLTGRCDRRCGGCGEVMPARKLHFILVHRSMTQGPQWGLLCGPCFVDGLSEAVA